MEQYDWLLNSFSVTKNSFIHVNRPLKFHHYWFISFKRCIFDEKASAARKVGFSWIRARMDKSLVSNVPGHGLWTTCLKNIDMSWDHVENQLPVFRIRGSFEHNSRPHLHYYRHSSISSGLLKRMHSLTRCTVRRMQENLMDIIKASRNTFIWGPWKF